MVTDTSDPYQVDPTGRFLGVERLASRDGLRRLQASRVAVIGLGGVGSWAAEALARSGVGHLRLVDADDICLNNMNRQIHTLGTTVGQFKTEAMADRIRSINPNCQLEIKTRFLGRDNTAELLSGCDMVVDAIDSVEAKCFLISYCRGHNFPLVSTGGAGGIRDVRLIRIADVARCYNDPLLARVRRILRTRYEYPRNPHIPFGVPCVFSFEKARLLEPSPPCQPGDEMFGSQAKKNLDCSTGYGTFGFVTGTFGLMAAGIAVEQLLSLTSPLPR